MNVSFSVPFVHRVRFTGRVAKQDFAVLADVLRGDDLSEHEPFDQQGKADATTPKVILIAETALQNASADVVEIGKQLAALSRIEFVPDVDGPVHWLDGGEAIKNSEDSLRRVLDLVQNHDLDRRSYIVVIGGGAILDAVGFAAAIAHRGIRLVRLPTTTLSQDDSGVGVKNAINYFGKKNWIGTFAVPWAVINDAGLLESLPDRDFRCGFSEAVKVSLLKSREDFDFLCDHARRIAAREMDVAFDAIGRSCLWHLRHITAGGDPFEALEARPLDFGHWSAHRLEPLSRYEIRHGEAVGIGVALDCLYSAKQHGLPANDAHRVCQCLADLQLPLWHRELDDSDQLLKGLEEFRQHLGGRLTVTMLRGVGDPINVHHVDHAAMRDAIAELKSLATTITTTGS